MVRIIKPQGVRNVWETDPIKELQSVGIGGLELIYWEDTCMRDTDKHSPTPSQLKEHEGQLVCARGYLGSFSRHSLAFYDEGGIKTSNFYKRNKGGIIQTWSIASISMVSESDKGRTTNHSMDEFPIPYSLLDLLEVSEPRGIPSARLWVESERIPNRDGGQANGFYLCGLGEKKAGDEMPPRLTIEHFVGRERFLNSLKKDKRIRYMPHPEKMGMDWCNYGEEMILQGGFMDDIIVCCKMNKFPLVDGWNDKKAEQDSFMWAYNTLTKIQEKYAGILAEQEKLARKVSYS
ncbi:MAG: hypothetical protein NT001_03400 [Candidatus Woesearchaeota archaeon]|nr:hypothetical protein [Candidatus Woesearchaeota archaeon]